MFDFVNGKPRVRKWPRSRGRPKTLAQKERQDTFGAMQRVSKYFDPSMMSAFENATQGTPLLPRDLSTMLLSQTMVGFILPSGERIYPMYFGPEVGKALDALTQDENVVLVRIGGQWVGLPYDHDVSLSGKASAQAHRVAVFTTTANATVRVPLDAVDSNVGFTYNAADGTFSPTVAGRYEVNWRVRLNTASTIAGVHVIKNGALLYEIGGNVNIGTQAAGGSCLVDLVPADHIGPGLFCTSATTINTSPTVTRFSISGPFGV